MRYYPAPLLLFLATSFIVGVSPAASLIQNPFNDSTTGSSRRSFLQKSVETLFAVGASGIIVASKSPPPAHAAAAAVESSSIVTQTVKVTPVAHTFLSSTSNNGKTSLKPLRENDATRYFTNARVVHLFYDGDSDKAVQTARDILQLTLQRKAGQGPGVTPGKVHLLVNDIMGVMVGEDDSSFTNIQGLEILKDPSLKYALTNLPEGDVVFVAPKKSNGTIINGMLVEQSARTNGLNVGGSKSGGVISCLINGPKDPDSIVVLDGGYTTSTILWYGQ